MICCCLVGIRALIRFLYKSWILGFSYSCCCCLCCYLDAASVVAGSGGGGGVDSLVLGWLVLGMFYGF